MYFNHSGYFLPFCEIIIDMKKKGFMKKIIRKTINFLKRLDEDNVGEYTAQCAYFTFLSFIPFIILLLSLIKYMNIERESLIYILESILPSIAKNSVLDIIQEVYSKSLETISVSAIFILWSAAKSFYALSLGLSSIYKDEKSENHLLLRIKGVIGTLIVIIMIIMMLVLIVFGNTINGMIEEKFEGISEITTFILSIKNMLTIIILFIVFVLMYKFVPNKKENKIKKQMPGAIIASIRMYINFIFFFNICKNIYKFFNYIWKFGNSNINYDVAICSNLYNLTRC